jgi:hypothetical protein
MKVCATPTCSTQFTPEQSSGDHCFRCKVKSIGFSFVGGGGYGRQAFHDRTTREVEREIVDGAKAQGREIEKVGTRWV